MEEETEGTQPRQKFVFLVLAFVFSINVLAFRMLENKSWLDSIYFLVVTISTVGFGDVTPSHPVTKVSVMFLIVTGITSIAIFSETAVDKIVRSRITPSYELSRKLDLKGHVVIGGSEIIAENIAFLCRDRFLDVVIVTEEEDEVKDWRERGILAYQGVISSSLLLDQLNLEEALVLYLFLPNDNEVIQTSIIAKQISPDLRIYVETKDHLSIEFGNLIGISRTYHRERMIASLIRISLLKIDRLMFPNQNLAKKSYFRIVLTRDPEMIEKEFPSSVFVGKMDDSLLGIDIFNGWEEKERPQLKETEIAIYTINKKDAERWSSKNQKFDLRFDRMVVGGFSRSIHHIIEHLNYESFHFEKDAILIISFEKEEIEQAVELGYKAIYLNKEDLKKFVTSLREGDLVVNLFQKMADSLLLNVMLNNFDPKIQVLQLAHHLNEIDVYLKSGANRIIIGEFLMSRAMLQIMLAESQQTTSIIYGNYHLFEIIIQKEDDLIGRNLEYLMKRGYFAIMVKRGKEILNFPKHWTFTIEDNVLLLRKRRLVEKY